MEIETSPAPTSAPWRCNLGNGTNLSHDCTVWRDNDHKIIAEIGDPVSDHFTPEDIANARLIVAAPDLLEALERLVEECVNDDNVTFMPSMLAVDAARAAIAKAKSQA